MIFHLTDEQQSVYEIIKGHPNNGILTLNAPAGTGKTEIIKYIYKNLFRMVFDNKLMKSYPNIIILAPTHKACIVINKKLGLNQCCKTIHQFLKAEQEINEETGEIYFVMNHNLIKNTMILIDEASMVNKDMFERFEELSLNNLIVFIGDAFQIPPVMEDASMVFKSRNPLTLTKNMRSQNSLSSHYLSKFRNGVEKIVSTQINNEDKKNKNFIYRTFDIKKDVVILAWTNAKVKYWNSVIREYKFNDDEKDVELQKYYIGENLIFSGYRKIDEDLKYYSSDIIEIKNLKIISLEIEYPTCVHMTNTDIKKEDIVYGNIDDLYTSKNKEIIKEKKQKGCELCGIKSHRKESKNIKFYEIKDQNNIIWLKSVNIENKEIKLILAEYRNKALIIPNIEKERKKMGWIDYYAMKNCYDSELNYSYACTVHKSQGSQWKDVFVDINNIRFNKKMNDNTRLAYTAISRMSDNVYFTT